MIYWSYVPYRNKTRSGVITLVLATVSERQASPIHARPSLGLAWIGGASLSETVAINKVITPELILFLQQLCM